MYRLLTVGSGKRDFFFPSPFHEDPGGEGVSSSMGVGVMDRHMQNNFFCCNPPRYACIFLHVCM